MMKEKSYSDKCEICLRGRPAPDGKHLLCFRKGVVEPDFHCRGFKYDPLKRKPVRPAPMTEHTRDEFAL